MTPPVSTQAVVRLAAGDGASISAALAALPAEGGRIELGRGVFTVSQPIVIDRDNVALSGAGADTVLWLAAKANCPVLVVGSTATPPGRVVRGIAISDLVIDGNRLEQDFECYGGPCNEQGLAVLRNNGITIRGAEQVRIERVVTRWARSGGVVLEKRCRAVTISELESSHNEFDGLAAYETEGCVFTRLNLHDNLSAGISVDWGFNRNVINRSEIYRNGSQGIFMRDSNENDFENLHIRENGAQGVFIAETRELPNTAARNNRLKGLTITSNGTQGIRINDASCTGNSLINSSVRGNADADVSLAEPETLVVLTDS